MTRAATAAALPLEGLPDIQCAHTIRTLPDEGPVYQMSCDLPAGHEQRDVPHRWGKWKPTGEMVEADPLDRLGDTF